MAEKHDPASLARLAARDRHRQAQAAMLSPGERLDAMQDLLARTWAMLEANADGKARFLRRNYRSRAVAMAGGDASHEA